MAGIGLNSLCLDYSIDADFALVPAVALSGSDEYRNAVTHQANEQDDNPVLLPGDVIS